MDEVIDNLDKAEQTLRDVEKSIESVGCYICDLPNGVQCWHMINEALASTQNAIRAVCHLQTLKED